MKRWLGVPFLYAAASAAVGFSIYFSIGVVADRGLGVTPVIFLLGISGQFSRLTGLDGFPTDSYLSWIVPLSCLQVSQVGALVDATAGRPLGTGRAALAGVLHRRRVTAADMATRQAKPQMQPRSTQLQTLLASRRRPRHHRPHQAQVRIEPYHVRVHGSSPSSRRGPRSGAMDSPSHRWINRTDRLSMRAWQRPAHH